MCPCFEQAMLERVGTIAVDGHSGSHTRRNSRGAVFNDGAIARLRPASVCRVQKDVRRGLARATSAALKILPRNRGNKPVAPKVVAIFA